MDRPTLLARLARKLESPEILGNGIGAGEQVIDFLARLEVERRSDLRRAIRRGRGIRLRRPG